MISVGKARRCPFNRLKIWMLAHEYTGGHGTANSCSTYREWLAINDQGCRSSSSRVISLSRWVDNGQRHSFRNNRCVLPADLSKDVMNSKKIYEGHIGIEWSLWRVRKHMLWPGMTSQVKDYTSKCTTCQSTGQRQPKETVTQTEFAQRPRSTVGADLFQFGGHHYLAVVDYCSNFSVVEKLPDTLSSTVPLIRHFARCGIPRVLDRDYTAARILLLGCSDRCRCSSKTCSAVTHTFSSRRLLPPAASLENSPLCASSCFVSLCSLLSLVFFFSLLLSLTHAHGSFSPPPPPLLSLSLPLF